MTPTATPTTTPHNINAVTVVGAGQMGGGIAQIAAIAGIDVTVTDTTGEALDRCRKTHDKLLARAVEKGRMEQAQAEAAAQHITYAPGGAEADAVASADIVIEAIIEDAAAKEACFRSLAQRARDTAILATNTSSISITQIAAAANAVRPGAAT
ncbi:MAG: 3-hydroxyacyl-CoA dehydrogenase NAD-binding domain-containing protein, partial [Planctomycetota bacterium]